MDVLSGGDSRSLTARKIIEVLESKKEFIHINQILLDVSDDHFMNKSFIRSCLKMFAAKRIVAEQGEKLDESYKLVNTSRKEIDQIIEDEFGGSTLPAATKDYYKNYGFDELVASVAKQIDHNGVTLKEYDIDRLWLCRFIDFLEKAKQYTAFRLSDNQIAAKKAADIRKQMKNSKNNG